MKDEPRPFGGLVHDEPTVIHHPDEDLTILARWLRRGMDQGARFWVLLIGSAVALLATTALVGGLAAGKSATSQAWIDLIPAKTAEDQLKVADANPESPVASWARLQAAFDEYRNGLDALTDPRQRDLLAKPRLDKALDLFRKVAKDAPKDSPQARGAAFGVARTLEARDELAEAIKQYKLVAETWKDSPEAKQSLALARALEDPENVAFYKELYAYKPPATSSGPGSPIPDIPPPSIIPGLDLDFGLPKGKAATRPAPVDPADLKDLAPPPPSTTAPPSADPPKAEAPKAEAPKAELPKVEKPADPPK